jgi:hypothetical protein
VSLYERVSDGDVLFHHPSHRLWSREREGERRFETPERRKPVANAIKLPSFYYCKKDEEWRGVLGGPVRE